MIVYDFSNQYRYKDTDTDILVSVLDISVSVKSIRLSLVLINKLNWYAVFLKVSSSKCNFFKIITKVVDTIKKLLSLVYKLDLTHLLEGNKM